MDVNGFWGFDRATGIASTMIAADWLVTTGKVLFVGHIHLPRQVVDYPPTPSWRDLF